MQIRLNALFGALTLALLPSLSSAQNIAIPPSNGVSGGASSTYPLLKPMRDPMQPIDSEYTRKIHEYTTEPFFMSSLVDYLPASSTVPTPKSVLGDIAGAKDNLPYSKEVYAYFRMLEKASPRVKVYSIGRTEEGREMLAVAIASDSLIADIDGNKAKLAKLADPRSIGMNDANADALISTTTPVYYITGSIHSPEFFSKCSYNFFQHRRGF